jgi:shikimate kinase
MNIVLIGFMGTGKSAVGRALATRLKARFIDTDAEIERDTGKHIAEIFAKEGEAAFRKVETDLLTRLAHDRGPIVVSTGGGTPLRPENVRLLKDIGPLVWLTSPDQAILGRVRRNLEKRPLLADHAHDPLARIKQMLAERTPHYRAVKDYEFDTTNWDTPEEVATCIMAVLRGSIDSWAPQQKTAQPEPQKRKAFGLGLGRG